MTKLWWMIKGYGSTKEKLLFVATLALLGVFVLVVYFICQMVRGVQEIALEEAPLPDSEMQDGIGALGEEQNSMNESYSHAH